MPRIFYLQLLFVILLPGAPVPKRAAFRQPESLHDGGASYALADFNGDGNLDVAATGQGLVVSLGDGKGEFHNLPPLAYGADAIVAGDFNGDGKPDIVVADGNQIVLLPGNGDGTFSAQIPIAYMRVTAIAAADLNGDGKLDLVVSSQYVVTLLGNGDGTFQSPVATPAEVGFYQVVPLVTGDFNGDGNIDLALLYEAGYDPSSLHVLLGKGNGEFNAPVETPVPLGARYFTAGDLNGDGKLDIAVTDGKGTLQVMTGNGTGAFSAGPASHVQAEYLAAADMNGDGKLDLVTSAPDLSILLNQGNGKFIARRESYPGVGSPVALGQFRKAGIWDALSGGFFYPNSGSGTFVDAANFPVPNRPTASAFFGIVGDFAGNGHAGMLVGSFDQEYHLCVYPGDGHGGFGSAIQTDLGTIDGFNFYFSAVAADFNGDDILDVAVTLQNPGGTTTKVLLGKGQGRFGAPATVGLNAFSAVAGDFNNDGKPDLALIGGVQIQILLGRGDGTFNSAPTLIGLQYANQGLVTDLNGDGNLDLVTSGEAFLGNGDGTFQPGVPFGTIGHAVAAADFDGDGIPDVVIPGFILIGNGDGTFAQPRPMRGTEPLIVGDFNLDGIPDIATWDGILLGKGDGTFSFENIQWVGPLPQAVADFNGDGKPDLAAVGGFDVLALINTTH